MFKKKTKNLKSFIFGSVNFLAKIPFNCLQKHKQRIKKKPTLILNKSKTKENKNAKQFGQYFRQGKMFECNKKNNVLYTICIY